MSLSDIMGHLALDVYAQAGIVLFLAAFVAIAINALTRRKDETRAMAAMPLKDDDTPGMPGPHGVQPRPAAPPGGSARTPSRSTP